MSSSSPTRQSLQLQLERHEYADTEDERHTTNTAREAAKTGAWRWRWKFWKTDSPSSTRQRKRRLPGSPLAPLSPSSPSPGRRSVTGVQDLAGLLDQLTQDVAEPAPPVSSLPRNVSLSQLPPLEIHLLQRPRLVLDLQGSPTLGVEHLVRLQEHQEVYSPPNVLQLAALPKKCLSGDELALMPCHSMHHRGFAWLEAERWREPLRDRDKRWAQDELPLLLSSTNRAATCRMTHAPGPGNRGKWMRTLQANVSTLKRAGNTASPVKRPPRVLLRSQGALISRDYCVVSVYGEGIYGRLYGAGLPGNRRCLHVEAYNPATSRRFSLCVTLQDLEWVFRVGGKDPEREALLAPGKKQQLLRQLIALLYFQYPDELEDPADTSGHPDEMIDDAETRDALCRARKAGLPLLRLSPEPPLNEAALRRLEREEKLRQDEARRLEELAALMAKPRRARHRLLCTQIRLRGRRFLVSVHHFPMQARNLVVTVYDPSSSTRYQLTLGLLEAAGLVRLHPLPRAGFSTEQTLVLAHQLLSKLRLSGKEDRRSNARMSLAVDRGRQGPGGTAMPPLPPLQTEDTLRAEMEVKAQRDGQRDLELELKATQQRLFLDAEAERTEIRREMAECEVTRTKLLTQDQTLKTRIEEIDAMGGASASGADMKQQHELRQTHKAARQTLKAELKPVTAQITRHKQRLQAVGEREKTALERAQRRAERRRKTLREEARRTVAALVPSTPSSKRWRRVGQRTWLSRVHIRPNHSLLAAGVCRVDGKRLRYSLFAVDDEVESEETLESDVDTGWFVLELYDPANCSRSTPLKLSRLEWLALTKLQHEHQLRVLELAPTDSAVSKRLTDLRASVGETRQVLHFMMHQSTTTTKKTKTKSSAPSTKKQREELYKALVEASSEWHRLQHEAPWPMLVKALCSRLTFIPTQSQQFEFHMDRCVFRAVLPVLCMAGNDAEDGEPGVVYCRLRADILPQAQAVVFDVWDPLASTRWRVEYPESRELLREFAVETFTEQQLHLEAIAMSLLLGPSAVDPSRLELRFED